MSVRLSMMFGLLLLLIVGCNTKENSNWQLVYKNDKEGKTLYGSKATLIEAVRQGQPIRVGFGRTSQTDIKRSFEHYTDAFFLTILDGKEVFAQVAQIVGQRPVREKDSVKIQFRDSNKWTKVMGTNGYSSGLMINVIQDTIISPSKDGKAVTSWFLHK